MTDRDQLTSVLSAIDKLNSEDPNTVNCEGKDWPENLLYSHRMTAMLHLFQPNPSTALQIAARAQHVKRWQIPRSEYPEGRVGYLKWRTQLKQLHARLAAEVMTEFNYAKDEVRRVRELITKKNLKTDEEAMLLEDVVCLVFLSHYFADFAVGHSEDKIISILQKTWKKMTEKGRRWALQLEYAPASRTLLEKALNQ